LIWQTSETTSLDAKNNPYRSLYSGPRYRQPRPNKQKPGISFLYFWVPAIAAVFAARWKIGTHATAPASVTYAHFAVVSGSVFESKSETMLRAKNPPLRPRMSGFVVENEKRLQLNRISCAWQN
jgi:hypothetical protein